ncbi:hypothetical protein HK097_010582 [Rhizophlyctis rosea]|uniref:Formamidopyrimidine-DNA glycosylase catalytic domain-containing protein n=1 Tax=Rhizophlyctis rosea TaxID=64517 RepID=A0AAD5SLK7_9FUNG|nr:hypothetical protein HK097_010582 [Rhizophlyctis rosea]
MNCSNTEFAETIKGAKVCGTGRWGKVFWISLEDRDVHPVLHLGMTGSVQIKGQAPLVYRDFKTASDIWPPKYTKFVLKFKSGTELAFTDPRRLSRIRLVKGDVREQPPVSELGFDPSRNLPELDKFTELIQKRNMPIKALLLDQSFSAGVGNWVADEVLYQANVHPAQNTQTLTSEELSNLHDKLYSVVQKAVEVNADSSQFPEDWLFHYRWSKGKKSDGKPKLPSGDSITFETVGGRTTAIVAAVQKLRKSAVTKKKTVKVFSRKSKKGKVSEEEITVETEESETVVVAINNEDLPPAKRTGGTKRKKAIMSDDTELVAGNMVQPVVNYVDFAEEGRITRSKRRRLVTEAAVEKGTKSTKSLGGGNVDKGAAKGNASPITSPHFSSVAGQGKLRKKRKTANS